jgi:hypothetical protein
MHYELTAAGREIGPIVTQLGTWAQRWYRSTFKGKELDPGVLMWDMRCTVDPKAMPATRIVVQFTFSDVPANSRTWWLVNQNGETDLCPVDPGEEPELHVQTTLRSMTRVWMGDLALVAAQQSGVLVILGPSRLRQQIASWLRLSPYSPITDARRPSPLHR